METKKFQNKQFNVLSCNASQNVHSWDCPDHANILCQMLTMLEELFHSFFPLLHHNTDADGFSKSRCPTGSPFQAGNCAGVLNREWRPPTPDACPFNLLLQPEIRHKTPSSVTNSFFSKRSSFVD